jgi:hypothetical protein
MSRFATSPPERSLDARPQARFHGAHAPHLPEEASSSPTRSKLPLGFAGMLGLIVLIEGVVGRNWLDFSDPVSLSWRHSASTARSKAPGCELLCLGDSLVKHGLLPSVIQATSGQRAVNLAAARCPTPMTYFLLRLALEAGSRPRAIVLDVKPAVLIGGLDFNRRYWQEVVSLREAMELFQISHKGGLLVSIVAGRLLPSLRARLEIRSNLRAALRGQTDQLHDINRVLWRNWSVNAGANVTSPHSGYHGQLGAETAERLHADRFYVDRANTEAIHRLLRLATAKKIPVFWLLPPLSPALQAQRDQGGAEARYEEFVRSFQSRHAAAVTVLDARSAGYAPELFVDATHLSSRGAVALSGAVATAIEQSLKQPDPAASSRWIKLGPPTLPFERFASSIEDLDQSRAIALARGRKG